MKMKDAMMNGEIIYNEVPHIEPEPIGDFVEIEFEGQKYTHLRKLLKLLAAKEDSNLRKICAKAGYFQSTLYAGSSWGPFPRVVRLLDAAGYKITISKK